MKVRNVLKGCNFYKIQHLRDAKVFFLRLADKVRQNSYSVMAVTLAAIVSISILYFGVRGNYHYHNKQDRLQVELEAKQASDDSLKTEILLIQKQLNLQIDSICMGITLIKEKMDSIVVSSDDNNKCTKI